MNHRIILTKTFSKLDTADSRQTLFGNIEMLMNEIHAPLKSTSEALMVNYYVGTSINDNVQLYTMKGPDCILRLLFDTTLFVTLRVGTV